MKKLIEEINKELDKAESSTELLEIYQKISKELNSSLEASIRRIKIITYDDCK